jgi:hypothetical protein
MNCALFVTNLKDLYLVLNRNKSIEHGDYAMTRDAN